MEGSDDGDGERNEWKTALFREEIVQLALRSLPDNINYTSVKKIEARAFEKAESKEQFLGLFGKYIKIMKDRSLRLGYRLPAGDDGMDQLKSTTETLLAQVAAKIAQPDTSSQSEQTPGPSSRPGPMKTIPANSDPIPSPSSRADPILGPPSRPDQVPGLSGRSDPMLGFPNQADPIPGPSSRPYPTPGPSSRPDPIPGPPSRPYPIPRPPSRPYPTPGPSSRPDPTPGPSSRPDPAPGPSSCSDPTPGPSSRPDPAPGPSSRPDPVPGPSSRPDLLGQFNQIINMLEDEAGPSNREAVAAGPSHSHSESAKANSRPETDSQDWEVVTQASGKTRLRKVVKSRPPCQGPPLFATQVLSDSDVEEGEVKVEGTVKAAKSQNSIIVLDDDEPYDDLRPKNAARLPTRIVERNGTLDMCNAIFLDFEMPEGEGWEKPPTCSCKPLPYDVLGETNLPTALAVNFLEMSHKPVQSIVETLKLYGESNISSGCKTRLLLQLKQLLKEQNSMQTGSKAPQEPYPQHNASTSREMPSTSRAETVQANQPAFAQASTSSDIQPCPFSDAMNDFDQFTEIPPPEAMETVQNDWFNSPDQGYRDQRDQRIKKRGNFFRQMLEDSSSDTEDSDYSVSYLKVKRNKQSSSSPRGKPTQPPRPERFSPNPLDHAESDEDDFSCWQTQRRRRSHGPGNTSNPHPTWNLQPSVMNDRPQAPVASVPPSFSPTQPPAAIHINQYIHARPAQQHLPHHAPAQPVLLFQPQPAHQLNQAPPASTVIRRAPIFGPTCTINSLAQMTPAQQSAAAESSLARYTAQQDNHAQRESELFNSRMSASRLLQKDRLQYLQAKISGQLRGLNAPANDPLGQVGSAAPPEMYRLPSTNIFSPAYERQTASSAAWPLGLPCPKRRLPPAAQAPAAQPAATVVPPPLPIRPVTTPSQPPTSQPSAASGTSSSNEDSTRLECCICLDARREMAFMPCQHMVCCSKCSEGINECPVCRKPIKAKLQIFLT